MDASRRQSRDRGSKSTSHSPSRRMSVDKEGSKSDSEGGLFLANPMACEEDSPGSPRQTNAFVDKPASTKSSKSRPKSPSFLRLLVDSFRSKQSYGEANDDQSLPTSISTTSLPPAAAAVPQQPPAILAPADFDNEEPLSPTEQMSDRRRDIEHIATLPRRPERKKKKKKEYEQQQQGGSLPGHSSAANPDPVYESIQDKSQHNGTNSKDDLNPSEPSDYHSGGLEALETLHSQLQILVHQQSEEEVADLLQSKVVSGLQQQLEELQKTLDCLQESDKNLRLALKMGEMKNKETEIKLQLTSDRCLRLEQRNRRLDHKYRLLLRQHRDLEKHLQKKAVLNQMVEQPSPGRLRRPHSAREHTRRASYEYNISKSSTVNALTSPVKVARHGSTDRIHSIPSSGSASLPRGHPGSLSHTETRV